MTREESIKLLRACAILFHGADEETVRLAENEFSGCAGTQRHIHNELEQFLKSETKNITKTAPSMPQPTSFGHSALRGAIKGTK